ncbi:transporter substrate-binding domain-containing protein, partial [Bradyrhizobium mercantei]|uniref:transporter substrate-binding domain-containing protein n=1 Tax=Bradyrhizobium mercantei TaxID=1904807 RepID=UPI001178CDE8
MPFWYLQIRNWYWLRRSGLAHDTAIGIAKSEGGDALRAIAKLSLPVFLLTLLVYGFPTFAQGNDSLLASIRKAGQVKVALASLPPSMIISPDGKATGASVDLQNIVLSAMGLPSLTPALTEWTAMIPGLQSRQFDYVGAGLSITEAACKAVVFSTPTYAAQIGLYVLPGNPKHLRSVADIAHRPDIKLAVVRISAQYPYVLKQE